MSRCAAGALMLAGALALGGCATTPPFAQPIDAPSIVYRCVGGKGFTAAYDAEGQRAMVTAGRRIYVLPQVISGSGIRYEQDGVELRSKGAWASLAGARGGPYTDCTTG